MYLENLYSGDLETEIFMRENAIELEQCENTIIDDLNIYQECAMFESGEDSDKTDGILLKICNKIKEMIGKIKDFISSFFKSIHMNIGDKLTPDDYISSDTAKIRLSNDYDKLCNEIEKEIAESHKIVNKLAKFVGVDAITMKHLTDSGQQILKKAVPIVLTTTAACVLGNKIKKNILKNDKVIDEINDTRSKIEKELRRKNSMNYEKLKKDGHPIMAELNKLTSEASTRCKKLLNGYQEVTRELNKIKKSK